MSRISIIPSSLSYSAIVSFEVKNTIFQRMSDVVRIGGSENYKKASLGQENGVDLHGNTMTGFMGSQVLEELLVMKKVGIYVDMPSNTGPTLLDQIDKKPYLYTYATEDIRSWVGEFNEDGFLEKQKA